MAEPQDDAILGKDKNEGRRNLTFSRCLSFAAVTRCVTPDSTTSTPPLFVGTTVVSDRQPSCIPLLQEKRWDVRFYVHDHKLILL